MNQKPIILVTGATGAQGGSVARALLLQDKFKVRILTRNPQSTQAVQLKKAGAEVVQGDLSDLESHMFEVQRLYISQRQMDLIESYGLNPAMQPFENWLVKNRDQFPVTVEAGLQLEAAGLF